MQCREIIAVWSQIHTKHTHTLCGQNVGFVDVILVVNIVTTGPYGVKHLLQFCFFATSQPKTNTLTQRHTVTSQHIGPHSSTAVISWILSKIPSTYSLYCLQRLKRCPSVQNDKQVCIAFEIDVFHSNSFRYLKSYQNLSKWQIFYVATSIRFWT